MKHWINQNYKTLIIAAFLIPIITVAVVSISHVTKWYGISNPVSWAIYLSIGIEIAALSALAAISANMGKKVYFPFAVVTLIQFIGNIFFAYTYIDINGQSFKDWVGLVSPLVEFMGIDPNDFVGHKRFLAFFAGGMLPIISLSFLHMLVKFTEEDRLNEDVNIEEKPKETKDIIEEETRIKLSDNDLKKIEEVLLNPPPPNENLKEAVKTYNEQIEKKEAFEEMLVKPQPTQEERHELLTEMMKNDQELGLYNEPFDNPMIKKDDVDLKEIMEKLQDREELFPESNQRAKEIIENSNWDVTLMDGLEDEEPFFTEEEIENILQEEPTEEEIQRNFSTIIPETENIFQNDEYVPSLSDEEIMEMNQKEYERNLDTEDNFDVFVPEPHPTPEELEKFNVDVKVINQTLEETNKEIDNTSSPEEDDEKKN